MNLCIFTGRLTRDPELRQTSNGKSIVNFAIAINQGKQEPIFVELTAWGPTGENINQWFKKGKPITVQTRYSLESWEDKNSGEKRSRARFTVDKFDFVPGSDGGGNLEEGSPSEPKERGSSKGEDTPPKTRRNAKAETQEKPQERRRINTPPPKLRKRKTQTISRFDE